MRSDKKKPLSEADFLVLMQKFAKKTRTTITIEKPGVYLVKSYDGMVDHDEYAPGFNQPQWAAWWAFRLLHPERLFHFDNELRELFGSFKKGERKWITYNEEKRGVLARYLREPHEPQRGKRRK